MKSLLFLGLLTAVLGLLTPLATQAGILSGTVFVDSYYGGGTSLPYSAATAGMSGRPGARVEIYSPGGAFLSAVTTAADGTFAYNGPTTTPGTYTVRVVSATVTTPLPLNSGAPAPLAVPIYNGATNAVGGANPSLVDAAANTTSATLQSLTVAQAMRTVVLAADGSAGALDFGFSFDVIVNTNNTGQGSLRQFVLNANAQANTTANLDQRPFNNNGTVEGADFPAGQETAIFMLADGTARPGTNAGYANLLTDASGAAAITNSRALITLTAALDVVTDAGTVLDATTQTTLSDSNLLLLGTGGRVGVGSLAADGVTASTGGVALSQVNGPEVEITGGTLRFSGTASVLRGVAVNGASPAIATSGSGTDMLLEGNVVGISAFTAAAVAANGVAGAGMVLLNPSGTVRNNLIGFCATSGLSYSGQGAGYTIQNNEIYQSGRLTAGGDNITVGDNATLRGAATGVVAGPVTITGNLLTFANSSGIQFEISRTSNNTITNNTIQNNGKGGTNTRLEGSGIHYLLRAGTETSTNTDLIQGNVLSKNQSSAIVINYGQKNVRITKNSIFSNGDGTTGGTGLIAIDYTPSTYYVASVDATGKSAYGQGDGVTPNDGTTIARQGNQGIDYPVLVSVSKTSDGKLSVAGYIGRANQSGAVNTPVAGNSAFSGATVEIFSANDDSNNQGLISSDAANATYNPRVDHGEAQSYLGQLTADANGNFSGSFAVAAALNAGDKVTATAYLPGYGTSEVGVNVVSTVAAVPLPVVLTRFEARAQGTDALLEWATASEKNSQYFAVERSANGRNFIEVGTVASAGTSSQLLTYQFRDAGAARVGRQVYYRLREVDADQKAAFSPVQAVTFEAVPAVLPTLAPNPAVATTTLDLTALAIPAHRVVLTDLTGRTLCSFALAGGQAHPLVLQGLAAGVYFVQVEGVAGALRLVVAE